MGRSKSCAVLVLALVSAAAGEQITNWQGDWSIKNDQGTYAARKGPLIRVGNTSLERVFRVLDGSLSTIQLVNKLSGRPPGLQQWPEFVLKVSGAIKVELSAPDFELIDVVAE